MSAHGRLNLVSRRHPSRRVPKARFGMTFAVLAVMTLSSLAASPGYSLFRATTTNTGTTFASSASFPTYPASVTADSAWAYYKGEETPSSAATLAATDGSGNARTGVYNGVTNGPSTYWELDEGTGSTVIDSSGAANPGTPANSPTTTTGKVGSALSFNGTTQYVNAARAAVDTSQSFSATAWVYMTDKSTYRSAITQDGTNVSAFRLQYDQPIDRWSFTYKNADNSGATTDKATDTSSPSINTWYHLAGVYDSAAGNIKLYVNGSLVATTAHTTVWAATGALASGRSKFSGANSDFFAGKLDEVRVYRRALTAAEILTLGGGLPVTDWEFSEGAGTTTADRGTTTQTVTPTSTSWTTSGHDGNALSFDGTTSKANGTANLPTNASYTVSAWVYLTSTAGGINRTAICQNGTNVCTYWLQYDQGSNKWAYVTSAADSTSSTYPRVLSTATVSTNTWYHLVGVYDSGAGTIRLYVNGTSQGTAAHASPWNATGGFRVGSGYWTGANELFPGRIDTVKLYPRALSATEVTDLYNGAGYTEADMSTGLTGALQGSQQGLTATTAVAYAGMGNGYYGTSQNNPTTFTIECWFRSTSTTGGVLMSFGGQLSGPSSNYDRIVYLDSGNKITYGVNPGGTKSTLRSTSTYNDGAWHHVAASLGAAGQKLYLDGALVASDAAVTSAQNFTGYWRWGGEEISAGWANSPTSKYFTGTIDEVAIYTTQLTDNKVARHYAANH